MNSSEGALGSASHCATEQGLGNPLGPSDTRDTLSKDNDKLFNFAIHPPSDTEEAGEVQEENGEHRRKRNDTTIYQYTRLYVNYRFYYCVFVVLVI